MLKNNIKLILILALALGIRLVGIGHSLPFVFHPDEPTIIQSALGIRFDTNPNHFDWPSMYIYMNYFLFMVFAKVRLFIPALSNIASEPAIFYLLGRTLTAVFGGLTIIPVYLAGKELFNKKTGLIAALALSVTPFHVWHSHYSLSDVPMAFFVAWAVYFSALAMKKGSYKAYLLAGLFTGLAASTKYNGALVSLVVMLAFVLAKEYKKIWKLILAGLASLVGFLIGTPYAILDYATFSRTDGPKGAFWQFTNVGSVSFSQHMAQFWNTLKIKLPDDFGYILFYLFLVVAFFTLYATVVSLLNNKIVFNDRTSLLLLIIPSLAFIFYISGFEKVRSHYFFIAYPTILLSVAYLINLIHNKFGVWVLVLILSIPTVLALKNSYTFYNGDTRAIAYRLIQSSTKKVIYINDPFDALAPALGERVTKGEDKIALTQSAYVLSIDKLELSNEVIIDNSSRLGPTVYLYEY